MKKNLYEIVLECKHGNKDSIMYLIEKFKPLISKYSKKLNYDGAYSDLIISFIHIVKAIPTRSTLKEINQIVGYISTSIYYTYIGLSKKYCNINNSLEFNEEILNIPCKNNLEEQLYIKNYLDKLSPLQQHIIKEIYFKDKTVISIAKNLNVSRQSVNKTKLRALKTLKRMMNKDEYI